MTSQHKPLHDAQLIQADAVRAIAVEAIRAVTGCADITGNGTSVVDEMERVARAAARIAPPDEYTRLLADRDQLAAEVEALRVDAELLDWIACQDLQDLCMGIVIDAPNDGQYYVQSDYKPGYGPTLRAAIDAARARKE
jgi:hypothetical protein